MAKKDKKLSELEFSEDQKHLVMDLINYYGTGQHPVCDDATLSYFYLSYLLKIIKSKKFEKSKFRLNEEGLKVLEGLELYLFADEK